MDEIYSRFTDDPEEFLSFMETLFLYAGFNFWNVYAARLIGFAVRLKREFNGTIPEDVTTIMSFQGVSRKVIMLLLQDGGFKLPEFHGVVGDSHVRDASRNLGMTEEKKDHAVAIDLEGWMPPSTFRDINEVFAGLRQLWRSSRNREMILEIARSIRVGDGSYEPILKQIVE